MKNKIPTKWDLSDLGNRYDDSFFLKERKIIEKKIKSFALKFGKDKSFLTKSISLKEALDQLEDISTLTNREGMYLFLMRQVNSENTKLIAAEKKYIEWEQKISDRVRFFTLSLGKIDQKDKKRFLRDKNLVKYIHYLKGIFDTSKYQLSEKEEKILSLKAGVASGNWSSMVSEIFAHEKAVVLVKNGTRRVNKTMTFNEIIANLHSDCKRVRNSSGKAIVEIFKRNSFVIEKEFNSVLENKKIDDELRGFIRSDEPRVLSDDITFKVLDTLIETVTDYFSISKEFYRLKANLMKQKKLHYHECVAPVFKSKKKNEYSYEDSVALIEDTFANFDKDFLSIFIDMVYGGKVDVYPYKGKRGGAFCMYHGKKEPVYVMLNHTGKVNDVMTLAHEIGHAIHGTLSKNESAIYYDTPMFTAETASTFCEGLVFDNLIKNSNEKDRLELMVNRLDDSISTIMRQIAAYNFEREVHSEFRIKGYLSKEEIGRIFKKHMSSYMGSAIIQDYDSENWWMYWSHFRSPFYVYSYASGLLIANGMHALIKKDPEKWNDIKKFFYTGTSKSPKQIFNDIGINIEDKIFWEEGLKEIKKLLYDTKKLAKKLGRI